VTSHTHVNSWLRGAFDQAAGRSLADDENFFDAGVNSLKLMRIHARAVEELFPAVELADFFSYPTLASLTEHLSDTMPADRPAAQGSAETAVSPPADPNALQSSLLNTSKQPDNPAPVATSAGVAQARLTETITQVIGRAIGPDENFFDAGLTSLTLMRLHARVADTLSPAADLADFFDYPTVALLGKKLAPAMLPETRQSAAPHEATKRPPQPYPTRQVDAPPSFIEETAVSKEAQLAELIRSVTGRAIAPDENFFDAGLTSLTLMRLHAKLIDGLAPGLPLAELFDCPTTRNLAMRLGELGLRAPAPSHPQPVGNAATRDDVSGNGEDSWYAPDRDIAVVGMAVDLPGAPDLSTFADVVREGRDCVERFGPPVRRDDGTWDVPARSMLEDPTRFDNGFFGIRAHEALLLDPQQRILLMLAARALADAGVATDRTARKNCGVFVSASENTYLRRIWKAEEAGQSIDSFLISILNEKDMLSSRIGYQFNLDGPAMTVQTACSSSLSAIHLASGELRSGSARMMLAGGVCVDLDKRDGYTAREGSIYSPDGVCRSFGADANGTVPASGAALVVLKRLDHALEDGDRIYAVIRGTAVNNDGSQKVNIAAPAERGQQAVLAAAQQAARVAPEELGYLEAHGTGTALGDPIEFRALAKTFETAGAGLCALGSIKSQMGHLGSAAGAAGFIRAALSVYLGFKPATLHAATANAHIDVAASPFRLLGETADWPEARRVAGVSSFGVGGANAHAIVASPPAHTPRPGLPDWRNEADLFTPDHFDIGDRDRPVDGWFYRESWHPVSNNGSGTENPRHVALLAGSGTDAWQASLLAAGIAHTVFRDKETCCAALSNGDFDLLLYRPEPVDDLTGETGLAAAADRFLETPLLLARSLRKNGGIRLVIAADAGIRDGVARFSPSAALAAGPVMVLPEEEDSLDAALVISGDWTREDRATVLKSVTGMDGGVFLAREGDLFRRGLKRSGTTPDRTGTGICPGDTVLITGGTGGIGRQLARHVLKVPETRVILLSRSAGPFRAQERLSEYRCDVTDPVALRNAVERLQETFGRIDGVIHAAGLPGSGLAAVRNRDSRLAVLRPKVLGVELLSAAFKDRPVRFFVACSSLASHVGLAGQTDYCAANAYLDAWAASAPACADQVFSIAWPSWKDTGMARDLGRLADTIPEGLQISAGEGAAILDRVLAMKDGSLMVTPLEPDSLRRSLSRSPAVGGSRMPLGRSTGVAKEIRRAFEEAIGERCDDEGASFFDLGGDSWGGLVVVDRLKAALGCRLSISDLTAHPSIRQLTRHIEALLSPAALNTEPIVVQLRDGALPPVVFAHPIGGEIAAYRDIVSRLPDRRVLGLQARGPALSCPSLAEQVKLYRAALPDLHGATLAGWSYGAVLVHELARQCEAEGQTIARMVLVDPPVPGLTGHMPKETDMMDVAALEGAAGQVRPDAPPSSAVPAADLAVIAKTIDINTRHLRTHRFQAQVAAEAVVYAASERPPSWGSAEGLLEAWQPFLTTCRSQEILSTDHYGCIRGSHARNIADAILAPVSSSDIRK